MESEGISLSHLQEKAGAHLEEGHSILYVAKESQAQGMIAMTNPLRPHTTEVISQLRKDGISFLSLISGDSEPVVKDLSKKLGFNDYRAAMLPEEKAEYVANLEAEGHKVLMVGDGVNDAPALSKASVGVAMGGIGSEVALEAADAALAKDDLTGLVFLHDLSRKTLRTIEQNFWLANGTNIIGIVFGAAGLLPPVLAGVMHVLHTLGITMNSGRLLNWNPSGPGRK
jgi:cation-transporting P-type ATPase C